MSVLLIAGSPSEHSRTAALLETVGQRLQAQGVVVDRLRVRDVDARALLQADFGHRDISQVIGRVAAAKVVVVATPVYKAAYSGVLKALLDVLPQDAFKGKTLLPLATGGSGNHMLALDYALRPVLQSLGARHILGGIFATDSQVTLLAEGACIVAPEIAERLDAAVNTLMHETLRAPLSHDQHFAPVQFSELRGLSH